jgi:hypothetical protein
MTPTFELMRMAVASGFMPLPAPDLSPPVEPLDAEEKATLIAWANECAPGALNACPSPNDGGDAALDAAGGGDK